MSHSVFYVAKLPYIDVSIFGKCNSMLANFKSLCNTPKLNKWFIPSTICLVTTLASCSDSGSWVYTNDARSPPLQYSRIR